MINLLKDACVRAAWEGTPDVCLDPWTIACDINASVSELGSSLAGLREMTIKLTLVIDLAFQKVSERWEMGDRFRITFAQDGREMAGMFTLTGRRQFTPRAGEHLKADWTFQGEGLSEFPRDWFEVAIDGAEGRERG